MVALSVFPTPLLTCRPFVAVNAMNHMNHLAALQAHHQRMMDPRLQPLRTVIPAVNPAAPMSPLSPRSSLPSAIQGLAPPSSSGVGMSSGLKRSFSPAHPIFSQANKPGRYLQDGVRVGGLGVSIQFVGSLVVAFQFISHWFVSRSWAVPCSFELQVLLSCLPWAPGHPNKLAELHLWRTWKFAKSVTLWAPEQHLTFRWGCL